MTKQEYWDSQFNKSKRKENVWKRQQITRRVLALDVIGKSVLEIGTGLALTAGAVSVAIDFGWGYIGTEVSVVAADYVKEMFKLNIVNDEITALSMPTSSIDIVLALDTLEHIAPGDRHVGYSEIDRVLKPFGIIAVNIPLDETLHDPAFDFGFTMKDLNELLEACRMKLQTYELYTVVYPGGDSSQYGWVVGVR